MNRHVWTMHGIQVIYSFALKKILIEPSDIQAKGRKSRSKCVAEPKSRKAPAQQKDAPSQVCLVTVSSKKHSIKIICVHRVINEGSVMVSSKSILSKA